ncbi:SIMPL domain-containing protein [Candidatus Saccharibacteria bacterium]|nr:SIMPL domain-containing protein [Candidatus Saccharibacteria bacterium]
MQINVTGEAKRGIAPDQITASVVFHEHAETYDEALHNGVQTVKDYLQFIQDNTDFRIEDFRTRSYSIRELFHTNRIEAKTEEDLDKKLTKTISDGFDFTQYAYVEFDFNRERLARLLALTSKQENAPRFHIEFGLNDPKAYQRGLIGEAYHDAQRKAETLAAAADKHLRDCIHVDIDQINHYSTFEGETGGVRYSKVGFNAERVEQEIKAIDETFQPDPIYINKTISCVWETSD